MHLQSSSIKLFITKSIKYTTVVHKRDVYVYLTLFVRGKKYKKIEDLFYKALINQV